MLAHCGGEPRQARAGPRPRAGRPGRLAQHGRQGVLAGRPARQVRAARLLDLLLHQLPARDRGAAPARGQVRRRARHRRRALAEVRARDRPRRRRRGGRAVRGATTRSWTTPTSSPGSAYAVRAWPTLALVDPEGYVVAQFSGEGHAHGLDAAARRAGRPSTSARAPCTAATGPYVPPEPAPSTLRFPAKAVLLPTGHLLVADAGHHCLTLLEADGETPARPPIGSGERGLLDGPPGPGPLPRAERSVPAAARGGRRGGVRRRRRRHREPRAARGVADRRHG